MSKRDITKTNRAVRDLIVGTDDPRHRFLLMAYDRHRNLEMAGRYEEIFAPDMMVAWPTYHIHAHGLRVRLEGQEDIKDLYRVWAATNESIFYTERESVAVTDHYISSMAVGYHQVTGRSLFQNKVLSCLPAFVARFFLNRSFGRDTFEADENSMYLYKNTFYMIWRYDARGHLLGEDIWEPDPSKAEVTKLAPIRRFDDEGGGPPARPLHSPAAFLRHDASKVPSHIGLHAIGARIVGEQHVARAQVLLADAHLPQRPHRPICGKSRTIAAASLPPSFWSPASARHYIQKRGEPFSFFQSLPAPRQTWSASASWRPTA